MPGYCCIESCWKNSESKHRFPNPAKDKALFNKWIQVCGNRRLVVEMSPEQVYNNYRVCSFHFSPQDFGPNHKLKKGVVPSAKLPEPIVLPEESQSTPAPVIIEPIYTQSVSSAPTTSLHQLNSPTESYVLCQKEAIESPKDNVRPSTSEQCASVRFSSASKRMTVKTEEEVLTLDKKAADTADLLEFLDKLFDSLNGSSFQA